MMEKNSLNHRPSGKWVFDESVTDCFDDMLQRSIPHYEVMRSAVTDMARHYVQPSHWIVDLGCSKGETLARFLPELGRHSSCFAVDISKPMLASAQHRFRQEISQGNTVVQEMDLRQSYPQVQASVTFCVLTLQFIPIEYRQRIMAQAYQHTVPGGAFILVEKVLGGSAQLDACMVSNYHGLKRANGYRQEEIDITRHSLEGVLVPLTAEWNEHLLKRAGFQELDCFWRWMNFAAWVAVRMNA